MMKKRRLNLVNIIYNDLCICGKVQFLLLLLIMISSILLILVTYQTRCMINNREKLFLEKHALDLEWNNLICEEKILSNYARIENIAVNKLQMHYVDLEMDCTLK